MTDHLKQDEKLASFIHCFVTPLIGVAVCLLMLLQLLKVIHLSWPIWVVIVLFLLAITDSQDTYISGAPIQGDGGEFL